MALITARRHGHVCNDCLSLKNDCPPQIRHVPGTGTPTRVEVTVNCQKSRAVSSALYRWPEQSDVLRDGTGCNVRNQF